MFDKTTYIQRREQLIRQIGSGIILLLGNDESPMNYTDNTFPFRQDSSFLYFFGLDTPHLAAIIDADEHTVTVFGDDISVDDIIWMGPQPALRERAAGVGVTDTAPSAALADRVKSALARGRRVHYLPPYRPENILRLMVLTGNLPPQIKAGFSADLVQAVVAQRSVKSDEEIAQIEIALETTHRMHALAMQMAEPGLLEQDIVGAMEGIAIAGGGRPAFPVILTVHGETLHNHYHGNTLTEGLMILNDSGAESALHYAADITSTFPVGRQFTPRQRDIYQIVYDAQAAATRALKPGVQFRDIHLLACRTLAAGLKDLGLMRGDIDEAVAQGAHALFFQCGLGHMMGLDVHDMEDLGEQFVGYDDTISRSPQFGLRSLRLGKALQPGYVITVEPGIYLIPALIDLWKSERKFEAFIDYDKVESYRDFGGVRLEDDVLITADGYRVLGGHFPKTIEEVEAVRAGR